MCEYGVKNATPLTLTTLTLSRWTPEEWLRWSLGEMDDESGGSSRTSQPTPQPSRGDSPPSSPELVEAFGLRGVLEARRGRTPSAHKGEGRGAHRASHR